MERHPVYGEYTPGHKIIPGFTRYTVDEHGVVKGPKSEIMVPFNNRVGLYAGPQKRSGKYIPHLILMAFFPHIAPLATVDHIDEDHTNNHLENLQWMTRSDNSKKSDIIHPRNPGPSKSKKIWLLDGRNGKRMQEYLGSMDAERGTGIPQASIRASARTYGNMTAHGKYFSYAQEDELDLPGEEWITSDALDRELDQVNTPEHKKVRVSNKGRIRLWFGLKKRGYAIKRLGLGQYRTTLCNRKRHYDHALIYMGFYNKPAPKRGYTDETGSTLVICHDDGAPLDENGCYRNYPEDLRVDTQRANMQEHRVNHESKKRSREESSKHSIDGVVQ